MSSTRVLVLAACGLTSLACGGLAVSPEEVELAPETGLSTWAVPAELERRLEREGLVVDDCSTLDADTVVAEGALCSFRGEGLSGTWTWSRFVSAEARDQVLALTRGRGLYDTARRTEGLAMVQLVAIGGEPSKAALSRWVAAEAPEASAAWVEAAAEASGWTASCEENEVAGNTMVFCEVAGTGTKGSVTVLRAPRAGAEGWVDSEVGATWRSGRTVVTLSLTEVGPPEALLDALLVDEPGLGEG